MKNTNNTNKVRNTYIHVIIQVQCTEGWDEIWELTNWANRANIYTYNYYYHTEIHVHIKSAIKLILSIFSQIWYLSSPLEHIHVCNGPLIQTNLVILLPAWGVLWLWGHGSVWVSMGPFQTLHNQVFSSTQSHCLWHTAVLELQVADVLHRPSSKGTGPQHEAIQWADWVWMFLLWGWRRGKVYNTTPSKLALQL